MKSIHDLHTGAELYHVHFAGENQVRNGHTIERDNRGIAADSHPADQSTDKITSYRRILVTEGIRRQRFELAI
jgi:hypothetical protein